MKSTDITLYSATLSDRDWAYAIKADAEYEFVVENFGWDESFQQRLHQQEWQKTTPTIIESAGQKVGFFSLETEYDRLFLRRFFIDPVYRGQGLGKSVISKVQQELMGHHFALWVAVFHGNRAIDLYRRMGFKVQSTSEQYTYLSFENRNRNQ